MTRWRSRQTRRRRKLLLLGLAVVGLAWAAWYRADHDHFPGLAGRHASGGGSAISLLSERDGAKAPYTSPRGPATTAPANDHAVSAQHHASVMTPANLAEIATTRPTGVRPAHLDPAKASDDADAGLTALQHGDSLKARQLLGRAHEAGLTGEKAVQIRDKMASLAAETLFSGKWNKNDPLTERVTIRPGETLGAIAGRFHIPQDFVAALNKIQQRNLIREGQQFKVVHGPFHVTVSKRDHLLDLYLQNTYIRSFRVALGMDGSTPTGTWKVANRQEDPGWADPRTGQHWSPYDPNNPIGEYWIGLAGVDGEAAGQTGYGIHGTIEPETIGKDVSMGCIRMAPEDIALLYKLLLPGESYVVVTE